MEKREGQESGDSGPRKAQPAAAGPRPVSWLLHQATLDGIVALNFSSRFSGLQMFIS
jgi:hypothetical protein